MGTLVCMMVTMVEIVWGRLNAICLEPRLRGVHQCAVTALQDRRGLSRHARPQCLNLHEPDNCSDCL